MFGATRPNASSTAMIWLITASSPVPVAAGIAACRAAGGDPPTENSSTSIARGRNVAEGAAATTQAAVISMRFTDLPACLTCVATYAQMPSRIADGPLTSSYRNRSVGDSNRIVSDARAARIDSGY